MTRPTIALLDINGRTDTKPHAAGRADICEECPACRSVKKLSYKSYLSSLVYCSEYCFVNKEVSRL